MRVSDFSTDVMIFYLIPVIIILICLLAIIFIVIKKLPNLTALKVETIPSEKENQVKNRIIIERLARKALKAKQLLVELGGPLIGEFKRIFNDFYQRILELEKKNLKPQPLKEIDVKQESKLKIEEAKNNLMEKNFEAAEKICIEILELDIKNLEAYEILAEIYLARKEYKKARETYRYLIKLFSKIAAASQVESEKHRLANYCANLGWVYQLENKNTYALNYYQKAIELEPNNPRFLDLLLKICIILKNKNLAQQTFSALAQADPENQKLAEIQGEIENLSEDK